jgi:CDP-diacylglycerol--glycerol-3-phosphate 3-phosphatidyltransferase
MTAHDEDSDLQFTNTPNLLTLARILAVPGVVALLLMGTNQMDIFAGFLFAAAAITDYFDGYLARKQKLETVYGQLMDPLADKFLVVSALCMLQQMGRVHVVMVILLICREMAITGLRALASSEGIALPTSKSAKWKTATQMVAIPFLMAKEGLWGIPLYPMGKVLIWISLMISMGSAFSYMLDFFRGLTENRKKRKALRLAQKQDRT